MKYYDQITTISNEYIKQKIEEYIKEDLPQGDITTENTVKQETIIEANIQSCENCVFIGEKLIPFFFNSQCTVEIYKKDGEKIIKNDIIGKISGPAKEILNKERIMLNLIQHLSGIATLTRKMVEKAEPHGVKILDTRKTTPGLRIFEKYSVKKGGGYNHRLNLSTGVLIKDNHIQASGGIKNVIEKIKKSGFEGIIELEIDTTKQAIEGLKQKVYYFLIDNMTPEETKKTVKVIRENKKGMETFIESSGGITLKNMDKYLTTGINAISSGSITHSKKNADIKMEFK